MLFLLALAAPLVFLGFSDQDDGPETVETTGTEGNDTINGGADNDLIRAQAGDDLLTGGAGDDTLLGFEGTDVLIGNNGNDMLCSGDDDDVISGGNGFDFIEGQGGDDWISADYNDDRAFGDEGDDTVIGGRGSDTVDGGEGDDVLFGGILQGVPLEDDELQELADGASLASILADSDLTIDMREDDRSNVLNGGDGDDTLFVTNTDVATGGNGADTFNLMFDDDNSDTPTATITDFDAEDDSVAIVFDAPLDVGEVTIEVSGADAIIVAGGEQLAVVTGAAETLTAADISIVAEDDVVALFDPNAAPAA